MKKLACLVLALLISLLSAFAVHAEETGTVNLTDAHAYETATSLCFIEDTLYVLGSYGVYEYKDGELKTLVLPCGARKKVRGLECERRRESNRASVRSMASIAAQAL